MALFHALMSKDPLVMYRPTVPRICIYDTLATVSSRRGLVLGDPLEVDDSASLHRCCTIIMNDDAYDPKR